MLFHTTDPNIDLESKTNCLRCIIAQLLSKNEIFKLEGASGFMHTCQKWSIPLGVLFIEERTTIMFEDNYSSA